MYKYTHPQTPSITGTVDEAMYLKMKADRVFKGYRWTKLEETAIEPTPEIKHPTGGTTGSSGATGGTSNETASARKALNLKSIEVMKAQEND